MFGRNVRAMIEALRASRPDVEVIAVTPHLSIVTLVNGFLTFIPPLVGWGRPPALPEYLFFATIETVCTAAIVWQAWTWPATDAAVAPKVIVGQPGAGISSS